MAPAIALISTYDHPSRDSIEGMVRQAFPEFEIDCFSTTALIKKQKRWWIPNGLSTLCEYGRQVARGTLDLKTAYMRTSYVLRKLHEQMRHELDPARHAFSFQMQSLYDTSVPGIPHYIYTDHTHLSNLSSDNFDRSQLRSAAWRELESHAYHHAACVFTRSRDVCEDLANHYTLPATRMQCVYAGANVRATDAPPAERKPDAPPTILFVGIDWERKGGPVLAQAFRQVQARIPEARLVIVGASPRLALRNCQVLGRQPAARLAEFYAEADVFCMPTLLEPFGVSFLEAMAHRLPVVGTRLRALPDLILDGVNGYLVPPGDPDQLATALIALLGDPRRCRAFGEAGFRHLQSRYTWEAVGTRIRERILRDLQAPAPPLGLPT